MSPRSAAPFAGLAAAVLLPAALLCAAPPARGQDFRELIDNFRRLRELRERLEDRDRDDRDRNRDRDRRDVNPAAPPNAGPPGLYGPGSPYGRPYGQPYGQGPAYDGGGAYGRPAGGTPYGAPGANANRGPFANAPGGAPGGARRTGWST